MLTGSVANFSDSDPKFVHMLLINSAVGNITCVAPSLDDACCSCEVISSFVTHHKG